MTVPERRTQRRTEIKRQGEGCGQVNGREEDNLRSGRGMQTVWWGRAETRK